MSVVVDANLITVIVSGDPRGEKVLAQFELWLQQNEALHAPSLALYEVANALTRLIAANVFSPQLVADVWNQIQILPITYHPLILMPRVIEIAGVLKRQNAYDAAYLALAESLGAELWTLDGPLYRNAVGEGFVVRLMNA